MKPTKANFYKLLRENINKYSEEFVLLKKECLKIASKIKLLPTKKTLNYHDHLLFMLANPSNENETLIIENELKRISAYLKKPDIHKSTTFEGTGLPYTKITTKFSHDLITWLLNQNDCELTVDSFEEEGSKLEEVLKLTLPSVELEILNNGYSSLEILKKLQIDKKQRLNFFIHQLNQFNKLPLVKDYLFDSLNILVTTHPANTDFSRTYNRFRIDPVFHHTELLKQFDYKALLEKALPKAYDLTDIQKSGLIKTIKNSLTLTVRETDPSTHLNTETLRYFVLERGIAIAIYGMVENRQLPFESYIGYTLFKNGFPTAYGGAWVFGKRCLFGMNIFEAQRGGESGYMMCQLMRVYRQVFNVAGFEVEPYQFGKDNPDGIKSGAFWFYYRYGFRPIDAKLRKLADNEFTKIKSKKGYFSSYKTLEKFTESNILLELEATAQLKLNELSKKITSFIHKNYNGNRSLAEKESCEQLPWKDAMLLSEKDKTFKEYALLANSLKIIHPEKLNQIKKLILEKGNNPIKYQQLLLEFLKD